MEIALRPPLNKETASLPFSYVLCVVSALNTLNFYAIIHQKIDLKRSRTYRILFIESPRLLFLEQNNALPSNFTEFATSQRLRTAMETLYLGKKMLMLFIIVNVVI